MNTVDLMRKYSEILTEDINSLDEFTEGYIEAMLWAETDDNGDPFDHTYSAGDIHEESMAQIRIDCDHFQKAANLSGVDSHTFADTTVDTMAGHDFWLTRAGHGSGFWDGDWPEPYGDALTELSKKFGEQYIYVGDDGELHVQ